MGEDLPKLQEDLPNLLTNKLSEAKSHASKNGKILGRVTRYSDIIIDDSEYIGIDIDFDSYFKLDVKRGQYLAIRGIVRPVIILGQVYSISRSDVLARMGISEVNYHEDPSTIMTSTYVQIKPITEAEYSLDDNGEWKLKEIRPAVSPVDPQSPVFIPYPSLINELLSIPSDGVAIGKIFSGGSKIDAIVKLDEEALTHHILIVGTTGAGKTTLLKNIVYGATRLNHENENQKKKSKIKTLIFDRQGDFIRYLIEKEQKLAVLMPVVKNKSKEENAIQHFAEEFAEWYNCDSNVKVAKDNKIDDDNEEENEEENAYGVEITCNNSRILLIPYSINFYRVHENFDKITPYFSPSAGMYWNPIIVKALDKIRYGLKEALNEVLGGQGEKKTKVENYAYMIMKRYLTPGTLLESLEFNLDKLATKYKLDLSKIHRGYKKSFPTSDSSWVKDKNGKKRKPIIDVEYKTDINTRVMTIHTGNAFRKAMEDLEIHHTTRDLIIRVLKAYEKYGIFSVPGTFDFMPDKLFSGYDNVIVDLSWVMNKSASVEAVATIAYKILDDFFKWKDTEYQRTHKGGDLTLIVMDEAHEYFPQTDRVDVAKDVVEGLINKIMRLGRVRNIGVILATHVPDDLNQLVTQLANTKVVMRNEEHVLNSLGMEKFKDFLKYARPGMAIVNSLRFNEVPILTLLDKEM